MKANGWPIKPLGDLCTIRPPKAEARKRLRGDAEVSFLPMEDLGVDVKHPLPVQTKRLEQVEGSYTYFADGDVLLVKITPCFQNGKLGIARHLTNGVGFGSSEFIVLRPSAELDREYLYYFLSRDEFRQEGVLRMGGAVGQQRIPPEYVLGERLPLPPLPEQRRIVGILDEAFAAIASAKANAEKNLQNARDVFTSSLNSVFSQEGAIEAAGLELDVPSVSVAPKPLAEGTKTAGRAATDQHIPGTLSLAVNRPRTPAKPGWQWRRLTDLARLETGHTPSRRHPEWWGGDIPWIGIKDARDAHGETITETLSNTNPDGIANSAARVLPAGTVCLSRTASVGYVTVMGREMATSQDFVNWVCSDQLEPHFLKYLLLAEGEGIRRFGYGSVHTTIYFPEVKAFYVCCPSPDEQRRIIAELDKIKEAAQRLRSIYRRKLAAIDALKKSLLHQAFSGRLLANA